MRSGDAAAVGRRAVVPLPGEDASPNDPLMNWRIEIRERPGLFDALGAQVLRDVRDLGVGGVRSVRTAAVYVLFGEVSRVQARRIAEELLVDGVTQEGTCRPLAGGFSDAFGSDAVRIEIAYRPGVMDPVEASTLKGIRDLGITSVRAVRTARVYVFEGRISAADRRRIVDKVLANKLIQEEVPEGSPFPPPPDAADPRSFEVVTVDLLRAGVRRLRDLSRRGQLFLNEAEMKAVRDYFRRRGRNPTDCELETLAQTWSEHCCHKTFRGDIRFTSREGGRERTVRIRDLFRSTIRRATETLARPWCVSVFHDNAGVIAFDRRADLCFKVETHNHPSALEPYGGANTGLGGVIRDILGTGLGARPLANTDVFCFGPPDLDRAAVPEGALHPRRVMKGVVAGVRDYGNKMGIPTVNGAVVFDRRYVGNPLVFCGTVGLLPRGKHRKRPRRGDWIVVAGGRTGRDGIHGATFSSGELTDASERVSGGAVQIGNPIEEKKLTDVLLRARDEGLYHAVTDCGAGGLSSAVGEMGRKLGARVDLDKVPLKYAGLSYTEIWISESQERMVLAVPPPRLARLIEVFAAEDVEATAIGRFTGDGRLRIFFHGREVCDMEMDFLHGGPPRLLREAVWTEPRTPEPRLPSPRDLTAVLLKVLGHPDVASKEWIVRQYDHEVQGGSVVKPLCGPNGEGPSDAAVIAPRPDGTRGFAVACGIRPRYGLIDPYWMAVSCIDEAVRQIVAVGGDPDRIAVLDNFCWGNPDKPDRLGGLVRAAQGCRRAATAYGTPFISGKDSLNNEYTVGRRSLAIPGTLLISAVGIVRDVRRCVTMDFKAAGDLLYLVGETRAELGGSVYYALHDRVGRSVPRADPRRARRIFAATARAISRGWAVAVHDCSDGGMGAALAEMAFAGGLGCEAFLDKIPFRGDRRTDEVLLFSETDSRFLVEVPERFRSRWERLWEGLPAAEIGRVSSEGVVRIHGVDGAVCVEAPLAALKEAWRSPLGSL